MLHWNGHRWTPHDLDVASAGLSDVAVVARDDVWAVGFDYSQYGRALIEHWDGSRWSRVEAPTEDGGYFSLDSVGFVAPDDGYAFGRVTLEKAAVGPAAPFDDDIMLHWDGASWTDVSHGGLQLEALDAVSSSDAWRVGSSPTGTTYAEHWDGSTWTHVPSPTLGDDNDCVSMTMLASDDVWVACNGHDEGTYTLHWDGNRWRLFRDVQTGGALLGIDGVSGGPVWLVGVTSGVAPTLERWAGHKWVAVEDVLDEAPGIALREVSAVSTDDAWAVGDVDYTWHGVTYSRRLLVHWDGDTWTRYRSPRG